MEGPTPVSALIHAATMVTAGVYMVARCRRSSAGPALPLEIVACGRRPHRALRRHHRPGPDRHQAHPRLLDHQPARLHVPGPGRRARMPPASSTCSPTPSSRPCSSSAPAASSTPCTASRTCARWAASRRDMLITTVTFLVGAVGAGRAAALRGVLLQGRDSRRDLPSRGAPGAVGHSPRRRVPHRALHGPPRPPRPSSAARA